ncbi:MAG: hypothetical protein RLZZ373_3595 [Pseudomonadota bacterium]
MAEACNTGLDALAQGDVPALKRDRLSWVDQNYLRDDTLRAANALLVSAQSRLALARQWGGGEVASADGMRFVVPVQTVHAGPNLLSDQFSGLGDITVPGTLRDSLILLGVLLEQPTEVQPTQIMTDTGAYSDVVFGLLRLLGYRFSPGLADVGGTLGRVPAGAIMRTLQVGNRPTRLALAIAEYGRIDKTLHTLRYLDDEAQRRRTLGPLNRVAVPLDLGPHVPDRVGHRNGGAPVRVHRLRRRRCRGTLPVRLYTRCNIGFDRPLVEASMKSCGYQPPRPSVI